MPGCDGCGAHVSTEYARVFADAHGVVPRCPRCGPSGNTVPTER